MGAESSCPDLVPTMTHGAAQARPELRVWAGRGCSGAGGASLSFAGQQLHRQAGPCCCVIVFSFNKIKKRSFFAVSQLQPRLNMDDKQCRYQSQYQFRFRWLKRKRTHLKPSQRGRSLQLLIPSTAAIDCCCPRATGKGEHFGALPLLLWGEHSMWRTAQILRLCTGHPVEHCTPKGFAD